MKGRRPYLAVAVMTLGSLFQPSILWAGMGDCRFALHRQANTTESKTVCTTYSPNATFTPCQSYVTTGPIAAASRVYMVIAHGGNEGIAGASFGIDYHGGVNDPPGSGIDPRFVTVTWCADGVFFPNDCGNGCFPRPQGGVRLTWNYETSCQLQVNGNEGVHAVIGALYCYAYTADQLQMTANNCLNLGRPELAVTDCAGITTDLWELYGGSPTFAQLMGRVDFGGGAGYNPCLMTPTVPITWGKIKSMYPGATVPSIPKPS